MNFQQFNNILLSRKWITISLLITIVTTTVIISLLLPKQYVATTSLILDETRADPVTGLKLPSELLPGLMATQVDVIRSHNVALKVVDKLKLSENPKMKQGFEKSGSKGNINDWTADAVLKTLDIKTSQKSSIISIDYTSFDPQVAANIANSFADAYIQTNIELRSQPAKLTADWFDLQMSALRKHLENAQTVLSNYQQQHNIVATEDRLDIENSRLAELSKQLVEGQLHTKELQSKKDLLISTVKQGGSSESLQEVLNNNLIQSLKTELSKEEARFAELSKRFDINHPKYKQAKAEVDNLQQKLTSEIKKVLTSISTVVTASNQRDKLLATALAEQKAKVLELKKQNDEIAVYKREVENAQKAFDTTNQRAIQTRMESELSETNIAVLNPALPPLKAAKPNVLINTVLSIFLGLMVGVGISLLAELMDRRVRSAFDISEALGIPVFLVTSSNTCSQNTKNKLFNFGSSTYDS